MSEAIQPTDEQKDAARVIWELVMEEPFNPKTQYCAEEIATVARFVKLRDDRELALLKAKVRAMEEVLGLMYDKWENGVDCREADLSGSIEEGSFIGHAVDLSDEEEEKILSLLPKSALSSSVEATAREEGRP